MDVEVLDKWEEVVCEFVSEQEGFWIGVMERAGTRGRSLVLSSEPWHVAHGG